MRLKFGQIQPWTAELAALDQFKTSLNLLLENYLKYFDDLFSGERLLPFGLLVLRNSESSENVKFIGGFIHTRYILST